MMNQMKKKKEKNEGDKKMKKTLTLTLIILVIAIALVGCSGGASQTAAAPTQEAPKVEEPKVEPAKEEPKKEEVVEETIVYKDGKYEGIGQGMHEIKVAVEVAGGKIAKVEIVAHEESDGIANKALEQIPAAIVEKNSLNVEAVSGATLASDGIVNAVKKALEAAK
ncbi:MAG: FMN-binding domain protein [Clostridia bacterium]|nr:FMN-binding domain protein [Clostridia bacterium]